MTMSKTIDSNALRRIGGWKQTVVTNGCFDIIHSGHVEFLWKAKSLGDVLIVGLNGDESVRMLKGESRPINNEEDRAKVLSAFWFVDYVYIFKEKRATEFLKLARPTIYVKAGDYSLDTLDVSEKCALKLCGAEIKLLPFIEGKSTTRALESINNEE